LTPAHAVIYRGLAQAIAERAQRRVTAGVAAPVRGS
jgi:hypothetical protein